MINFKQLEVDEMLQRAEEYCLVDVRTEAEF
ncbi:MAG TPA: hypothetical protein DDY38_09650, partial [Firmicutes bacterium]|nr:hypothetical protein [Bacillota bacterium]